MTDKELLEAINVAKHNIYLKLCEINNYNTRHDNISTPQSTLNNLELIDKTIKILNGMESDIEWRARPKDICVPSPVIESKPIKTPKKKKTNPIERTDNV